MLYRLLGLLLLVLVGGSVAQAQDAPLAGMSSDEIIILNEINRARLRQNLAHLVPNADLNQLAQDYVDDLIARPIDALGDVLLTSDGRNLDAMLAGVDYPAYAEEGYIGDFIPIVIRAFDPTLIVDYLFRNQDTVRSRRMIRLNETQLPVFSAFYREIGIASRFNPATERYYYAIFFGARPNTLPVTAASPVNISAIATLTTLPEEVLYIHDERVNRIGRDDVMGAVEWMHISADGIPQPCPVEQTGDWRQYELEVLWPLGAEPGLKTIYVQLCDNRGVSVLSSTQIDYQPDATITPAPTRTPEPTSSRVNLPTPDVVGIANATQTAAASATFYAPFQQTVEVILTATAAAP